MKADSPDAIEALKEGSVRSVICTGDNEPRQQNQIKMRSKSVFQISSGVLDRTEELTGIAIGRLCGVVTSEICLRGTMENGKLVWNDPDNEGQRAGSSAAQ